MVHVEERALMFDFMRRDINSNLIKVFYIFQLKLVCNCIKGEKKVVWRNKIHHDRTQ